MKIPPGMYSNSDNAVKRIAILTFVKFLSQMDIKSAKTFNLPKRNYRYRNP